MNGGVMVNSFPFVITILFYLHVIVTVTSISTNWPRSAIHMRSKNCPSASSPFTKCPVALYSTTTEGVGTIDNFKIKYGAIYSTYA